MDVEKRSREITDEILAAANAVAPVASPILTWAVLNESRRATNAFYQNKREEIALLEEELEALGD